MEGLTGDDISRRYTLSLDQLYLPNRRFANGNGVVTPDERCVGRSIGTGVVPDGKNSVLS